MSKNEKVTLPRPQKVCPTCGGELCPFCGKTGATPISYDLDSEEYASDEEADLWCCDDEKCLDKLNDWVEENWEWNDDLDCYTPKVRGKK